jgi:hypothetical protein
MIGPKDGSVSIEEIAMLSAIRKQCSFRILALVMLNLCFSEIAAHAQVLYGSITGNVTDQSGAVIANASVEALNTGTGISRTATTDSNGNFRFNAVQPGIYKVTLSGPGFASKAVDKISVLANTVQRVDAQLGVATQQQSVEVTDEAPMLQTDKADVHSDLSAKEIGNLAISGTQGRNFQSLLRIIPGSSLPSESNSLAANPARAITSNVNGGSSQTINTRLDGAQDAYPWLPANVAYVPPADAIETVNIVTNSFDAEQGMAGGAAVNVQIKSGTNKFHGTAHEFHTDQNFAARDYFKTDTTLFPRKNRNNQNQFGGTFGGPIRHDKLFFFADYERTTQRGLAGPQVRTMPTPNMVTGDFRGLLDSTGHQINIYDPATGDVHGAGKQIISCNGTLNVICPNRIDPASQTMIKLLQPSLSKEYTTSDNLNNWQGSGTAEVNRDTADFKINYVPNSRTTTFGRYSFSKSLIIDPALLGDAGGDDAQAGGSGQQGSSPGLIQSVGLGATYTITPAMLFDWNFGYTRQRLSAAYDLSSPKGLQDLKIPGTNNAGSPGDPTLYNGLPGFTLIGGLNMGNAQSANPFLFRDNQFVTGANLSWNRGRHNIRGGIEWNHTGLNHFQPQGNGGPRGKFGFNGQSTALQGTTPNWFNGWAQFMLGLSDSASKTIPLFNPTALRWTQWAWFIRDQWQVTPKLTATIGVRWERYPFGYSDNGHGLNYFNPSTGNVMIGGFGSVPQNDGIDVGSGQFLPRVGLAYRLTSSTVIRAGYGQSADPTNWRDFRNNFPSNNNFSNVPPSGDFVPATSLTGLNANGLGNGSYSVSTGIVLPYSADCHSALCAIPALNTGILPLPTNTSIVTIPNPFHRGYVQSFNLMVQQEWRQFVFETGYVGARGVRPLVQVNINASLPGTGQAGGLISQALGKTYTGTLTSFIPFKRNSYDSMQTKVTYRIPQGSTAGFVWTWGKAQDYSDNEDFSSLLFPHPQNWDRNHAVTGYDRTHNFEIYGVMQLPFGKDQRWLKTGIANQILGGWQVSPTISYITGAPFTVTCGGNLNANGATQVCDLVGTYRVIGGTPLRTGQSCALNNPNCHYFDPSAFAAPLITSNATAHFGNTGRNEFRGPGFFGMNLGLAREFKITERIGLQLRADTMDLTNTPHFNNPSTGCPASATNPATLVCTNGTGTFGAITSTTGADPGNRNIWLAARLTY